MAVAGLRGEARRRAHVRAPLGSTLGGNASVCMRDAIASETRACAGLCGARHGEVVLRRWRCAGVPAF